MERTMQTTILDHTIYIGIVSEIYVNITPVVEKHMENIMEMKWNLGCSGVVYDVFCACVRLGARSSCEDGKV